MVGTSERWDARDGQIGDTTVTPHVIPFLPVRHALVPWRVLRLRNDHQPGHAYFVPSPAHLNFWTLLLCVTARLDTATCELEPRDMNANIQFAFGEPSALLGGSSGPLDEPMETEEVISDFRQAENGLLVEREETAQEELLRITQDEEMIDFGGEHASRCLLTHLHVHANFFQSQRCSMNRLYRAVQQNVSVCPHSLFSRDIRASMHYRY